MVAVKTSDELLAEIPVALLRLSLVKKPRTSQMTIIVGCVIKDDQIIMASDSQTTDGNRKRLDAKKIHVVKFGQSSVLIAESGFAELSSRAVAMIRERAENTEIDGPWCVSGLCEKVISEIRQMMCTGFPPGFTMDGLQKYIENEREFSLTVGHFWDFKPKFFTISNATQVASPKRGKTIANGCGADLAEYILNQYYDPKMSFGEAAPLLIYTVEKVKDSNPYCGGPTQVALLQSFNEAQLALAKEKWGADIFRSTGVILPADWSTTIANSMPTIELFNKGMMRQQMMAHFTKVFQAAPAFKMPNPATSSGGASQASPEPPPQTSEGPK